MKILVVSDTYVPEPLEKEKDVDLVISCGDLTRQDIEIYTKPVIGVYGNHCDGKYLEELGKVNLHLKVHEINGIKFGGFESCRDYKFQENMKLYSDEEVDNLLKDFPPVDVFVSHSTPNGVLDILGDPVHMGFFAFNDYIKKHKPKIWLCGHSGENEEEEYNGTKVYRTEGYRFLEI